MPVPHNVLLHAAPSINTAPEEAGVGGISINDVVLYSTIKTLTLGYKVMPFILNEDSDGEQIAASVSKFDKSLGNFDEKLLREQDRVKDRRPQASGHLRSL